MLIFRRSQFLIYILIFDPTQSLRTATQNIDFRIFVSNLYIFGLKLHCDVKNDPKDLVNLLNSAYKVHREIVKIHQIRTSFLIPNMAWSPTNRQDFDHFPWCYDKMEWWNRKLWCFSIGIGGADFSRTTSTCRDIVTKRRVTYVVSYKQSLKPSSEMDSII